MRADIVPGASVPDYELPDHTRTRRRLSELQDSDPLVLLLSRGHFCPKEHQHHLELATPAVHQPAHGQVAAAQGLRQARDQLAQ